MSKSLMKKVRPRLPPPFPERPPARVVAPVAPPPAAPPPSAKASDEVVDLGDDLVEDFVEEVTVQAPAPLPPPERERFRTLRSLIPAQLAESMAAIDRDRWAASLPVREQPEPVTPTELTLPSPIEHPRSSDQEAYQEADQEGDRYDRQEGEAHTTREAVFSSAVPSDFASEAVSAPSFAAATSATTVVRPAPRSSAIAPGAEEITATGDSAEAPRSSAAAPGVKEITATGGSAEAPPPPMDAAAPMAAIHDEVTVMVARKAAAPEPEREPTEPASPWIELVAEPAVDSSSWSQSTRVVPVRSLHGWLDLRGVFTSDGATIAADPGLPDEIFACSARDRPRAAPSGLLPLSRGTSLAAMGPTASGGGGLVGLTTNGTSRAAGTAAAARARAPSQHGRRGPRGSESGSPAHRVSGRRPPEQTLPRGAIIDKYRIDRLLGKGGFAAVYRATHLLLNTQVAIKLLRPQVLARHAHLAKLLYEEARFAARIDHPNVVKVFDVTHSPSITYIVMEYIDGRSLADALTRERALPWPRVVEIGAAVAAGLKVALEAHLIHRDIKPANILLGKRGEIKIVDLGLVLRAGTVAPEQAEQEPATGRRSAIGTFGYMAPEQAVDPERIDFRADIYALGATLYEAAVGAPPFPLGDPARSLEMHAHEPPPPPETRRPGLPPELSALLLRMLAKKPDDRFDSYDALIAALKHLSDMAKKT